MLIVVEQNSIMLMVFVVSWSLHLEQIIMSVILSTCHFVNEVYDMTSSKIDKMTNLQNNKLAK
jgi:hypothetical protein